MEHENINTFFDKIDTIKNNSTLNMYLIRYTKKGKNNNNKLNMPEDGAINIFHKVCDNLKIKIADGIECKKFNPVESGEGVCEWIEVAEIDKQWKEIIELISNNKTAENKEESNDILQTFNFSLIDVDYNNLNYKICTVQSPSKKFLYGKNMYKNKNGHVEEEEKKGLFFLSNYADFIIAKNNEKEYVYILNRKSFMDFFSYDAHLQEKVKLNLDKFRKMKFINSFNFIEENINVKYVYKGLAKIVDDDEYIGQMEKTNAKEFKDRLLENCNESFNSQDFDPNDMVILNKKNLHMFIKVISKQLRYNFFTGKADD